jgi:hypothetical protein
VNKPYSIRIFLPGGDPEGLRTIEKSNWSGAGIVIPRALMGEARGRRELNRTGVYLFAQDYVFPSPSTAAGVVQGRAANGRVDWKTKEGKTLKELQDRQPGD